MVPRRVARGGRSGRRVVNIAARSVDATARMAQAWDGIGRQVFTPPFEHQALLARAGLSISLWRLPWATLEEYQRKALMIAARQGVELGRACAWVYGEGQGA